jgi:hypothetical protein
MAAIIGTATKQVDKFGSGRHGFTGGDAQAGVSPTQFSADWCDSVAEEPNNVIADAGYESLDSADYEQLAKAIDHMNFTVYPRRMSAGYQTFRTDLESALPVASASDWVVRRKVQGLYAAAQNTTQTWCAVTVPDDSQFWVLFTACIVQRDSLTTYNNVVLRCSCRRTGGTTTIQKTTVEDSDSSGMVVTWSVVNSSGNPAIRAQLPAAAGKTYNLVAYGELINVIRI